ncbi:efflux transporter outer membrane subunit [Pusillimonas sp. ANT_WB101]|uniref:efflux transporter outer membrane subunit n=1 Tax=Pusillimonas sp. ANT_WB101 TaxID=2597356 RepID=UPI0011EDB9B3|nr:efflux transporter outer membrane subunit [Pusillimonas sp. ANT_WB101]KAA0889187.1 efflux transporter outer membrane subunit [Pusillimonas sp. ANT_WB101]
MGSFHRHLFAIVGALTLAGCATSPALDAQPPDLPAQWTQPDSGAGTLSQDSLSADWWRSFDNAELDVFVTQAQAQSQDIAAATARVRQAQASARIAGAALLPEVSAGLDAGRQVRLGGHADVDGTLYAAGLSASYEVDFWGRNRAARDSAVNILTATRFDHDTVRLTVTAGTANAWVQAVALAERTAIAEHNLDRAERLLSLVQSQYEAGSATQLAVAQQRTLVASQRRSLAALRQQANQARVALAHLTGQAREVTVNTPTLASIRIPAIDAGVPSELLVRRPDIARAEAQLTAADADVVVARAAMLPNLTFAAYAGANSNRLGSLFDNPLYSLAAGLAAPIFNAGRLAAGHDLAQARREELLADYRQAIVMAFSDVQMALAQMHGVQAQLNAQFEELTQAQLALTLAESRYRAGAETLLTLLDTQRPLYAAQDMAAQLKALHLQSAVDLYRVLGGGWRIDEDS